jgi:hypothetical protein
MRLGFTGDYLPHGSLKLALLQSWFLQAIRDKARVILEELNKEPFEQYSNAKFHSFNLTRERRNFLPEIEDDVVISESGNDLWDVWNALRTGKRFRGTSLAGLRAALKAWAETSHLTSDWCSRQAFYTLDFWYRYSDYRNELKWATGADICLFGRDEKYMGRMSFPAPPLGCPAWAPYMDSREIYMARIEAILNARIATDPLLANSESSHRKSFVQSIMQGEVAAYCNKVKRLCDKNNWQPVKELKSLKTHIAWTVRYQVREEEFPDIARSCKPEVTTTAVEKAVKSMLRSCLKSSCQSEASGKFWVCLTKSTCQT